MRHLSLWNATISCSYRNLGQTHSYRSRGRTRSFHNLVH